MLINILATQGCEQIEIIRKCKLKKIQKFNERFVELKIIQQIFKKS